MWNNLHSRRGFKQWRQKFESVIASGSAVHLKLAALLGEFPVPEFNSQFAWAADTDGWEV